MSIIIGQTNESTQAHDAMIQTYRAPDAHSFGVFHALDGVYKALSEKIVEKNDLMRRLVTSGLNPMNILNYPMCGRCETLALWDTPAKINGKVYPRCTCVATGCGHSTLNPVLLRTWLFYELKRKAPPDFAETLEYTFDRVAQKMVDIAQSNLNIAIQQHVAETNPQMFNSKADYEHDLRPMSQSDLRTNERNQLDESEIYSQLEGEINDV